MVKGLLSNMPIDLPGSEYVALREDILDLLKGPSRCLREAKEDMDEGGEVEGAEDEVRFVSDRGQTGRDGPGQGKVE